MKTYFRRLRDLPYAMLAAAAVSVAATEEAAAANDIGTISERILNMMSNVGKLIVAGSFVGGIVLLGTGLMKLKTAAENPNQAKYSEGIWRVVVGAGLIAIPTFSGTLQQTIFGEEQGTITAGGGVTF